MSIDPVISAVNLCKRYQLNHQGASDGLRHRIEEAVKNPLRWLREANNNRGASREEFWALTDVSFEVAQGEVVAIIGRNGAGKSTLLKILSRITAPTSGHIRLNGRVASLLEVGTGFHQELTGRENIYLNGAILGMRRSEIARKFSEIVEFAEVGRFLDTPVKRYSSGMYVRLAFAVAAHLEPEILIVDEVLAVGDAAFQKKCLGKMGDVAKGGRTVLFVSHNMSAVQALCTKAIHLDRGRVKAVGPVTDLVSQYLIESRLQNAVNSSEVHELFDNLVLDELTLIPKLISSGAPLKFTLTLRATKPVAITELQLLIYSEQNVRVAMIDLRTLQLPSGLTSGVRWTVKGEITSLPFVEGEYSFGLYVNTGVQLDNFLDITTVTIRPDEKSTGLAPYALMYRGIVELQYCANVVAHGE